jgi:hypothetical protein
MPAGDAYRWAADGASFHTARFSGVLGGVTERCPLRSLGAGQRMKYGEWGNRALHVAY